MTEPSPNLNPEQPPHEPVVLKMPNYKPTMTYTLVGISVFFFIAQYFVRSITGTDLLFIYGGKIDALIMSGQFWRLLTPTLLHSSILHLALNMYALYILGRRIERFYGHGRFLLLYVLSGFAGNVLSFVLTPYPSLGASTAIFGLLSAEGIFIFQNRKLFGPTRTRQAIANLGMILFINLVYGFMPGTNIDNMGHIGGLLGGFFFAWKAGPLLRLTGQPPMLDVRDVRTKNDILIASLLVAAGFTIIAVIPFITS